MFLISQILASIAFLLEVMSFQFKARSTILLCLLGTTFLLAIHYFVLNQYAGGALMLLSASRYLISFFFKKQLLSWLFISAAVIVFYFTFSGPISFLPLFASSAASFVSFQQSDKPLRLGLMFATIMWLIYNILIWSPVAIFIESFSLCSNFIGYWRFYIKKN